ncbi:ester cyclase [Mesorhizobium sp.]|uniref:ester cyclase n=1 Tax=Mesorhizobium sp. TaxID=1871066 RepID=UPI0025F5142A|nr:ester cyclase [Mesorhizobium sp.]
MTDAPALPEVFSQWEKVWHERAYDLAPDCVADHYIRHDESGNRTVTRETYLQEIRGIHAQRPDIRVIVFDHDFGKDRAWFRFMFRWTDAEGKTMTRAGMQSYRTEGGRLAETWIAMQPLGSTWADTAQPTWTTRL